MSYLDFQIAATRVMRCQNSFHQLSMRAACADLELNADEKRNIEGLLSDKLVRKFAHNMSTLRWARAKGAMPLAYQYLDADLLNQLWFGRFDPCHPLLQQDDVAHRFIEYLLEDAKPFDRLPIAKTCIIDILRFELSLHMMRQKNLKRPSPLGRLSHDQFRLLHLTFDIPTWQRQINSMKEAPDFLSTKPRERKTHCLILGSQTRQTEPKVFLIDEHMYRYLNQERLGGGPLSLKTADEASLRQIGL